MAGDFGDETTMEATSTQVRGQEEPQVDESPVLAAVVSHWPWLAAVLVSVALITFECVDSGLFKYWWKKWMEKDSYYSHAVLVPFISAFAVYLDRRALAKVPVSPSFLGLTVLLPCVLATLIARSAGIVSIMGLAMPPMLFGAVWFLMGGKAVRRVVFPIGFLLFMCVLPGFILTLLSFRIQLMSTTGAALILRVIGLDPQQSGAVINLPNAQVLVGQPCSGFRLLISLSAFAVFFAYMREGPGWGKLALVVSTLPLSLLVNSIRIFMIALVGEYFGSEAMHAFHDYSGYLVLVLAFAVLWQLSKVVRCQKFKAVLIS